MSDPSANMPGTSGRLLGGAVRVFFGLFVLSAFHSVSSAVLFSEQFNHGWRSHFGGVFNLHTELPEAGGTKASSRTLLVSCLRCPAGFVRPSPLNILVEVGIYNHTSLSLRCSDVITRCAVNGLWSMAKQQFRPILYLVDRLPNSRCF